MISPLRKQVVESLLRDILDEIAFLRDRCRREGEISGWNHDAIRRLEVRAEKLREELAS